jgi:hypothetical protein
VHFQDLVIILVFNLIVILIFFIVQKRAIAKNIKHLKDEIQELEDLVAAIIEEFEEIANPENPRETEIEESWGRMNTPARLGEFELNLNSEADESAPDSELGPYENDLEIASFLPEEELSFQVDGEEAGLFNQTGTPEEDVKLSAPEYSPGIEFGLFKAGPNQKRKSEGRAESAVNSEFINDPKHRRIFDLWKQGLTVEEIARQLSMGRGEVQLILGIYRRG